MDAQRYCLVMLLISRINCSSKHKRTLTYIPPGGVIQMVMGVGLPLVVYNNAIIMGLVLKAGYGLPSNSTHYTNPKVVYAKKRSISRWDVYDALAETFKAYGFGGKECILRTICELAHTSLNKDNGILEEIIHTIFTPSTTSDNIHAYYNNIYHAAEQYGKDNYRSCQFNYPNCPKNFAHLFTMLY
ncbi:hypothetical protein FQR65_LT07117 [Abscondita terminalis]|nr:hypothetical protein FQR65_LT07117 [Abscondita terminalis]